MSWSQFCGLLEIDPARLRGVEVDRVNLRIMLVLEPEPTSLVANGDVAAGGDASGTPEGSRATRDSLE